MKSTMLATAVSLLLLASNVVAQTTTTTPAATTALNLKPIQTLDCYKSNGTLTKMEEYDFASDGWCQRLCGGQNLPVMALTAGSICYCGDTIPGRDQIVPESKCNSPCNGFNASTCGGFGYWQVYLTGLTNDVHVAPNSTTSSSSTTTPTATKGAETIVVTTSAGPTNSGPSKVGIAVGVVVGVVGFAIIIGGLVYIMKQRKRRAIEEDHRRLEAQAAALAAEKSDASSSRTDQRLDPSIFSHRRESIGSIADEMDFSRRILQVRNPDRFSAASPVP